MAKVLTFKPRKTPGDIQADKFVQFANEIDAVMLRYLNQEELDAKDLVGVLAHRLGTFMGHVAGKDDLWGVCEKVMKRQAKID